MDIRTKRPIFALKSFRLFLMTVILSCLCFTLSGAEKVLALAENGKTAYVIVEGSAPSPAEKRAARELQSFLKKVTGVSFKIRNEGDLSSFSGNALYVGQTRFARQKGIDFKSLGKEEWIIQSYGKDLVLTGGRTRGTLYAVYEFLEQQLGCRWFDEFTEYVPSRKKLHLKALAIRKKPVFSARQIGTGKPVPRDMRALVVLRARNKDTRNTCGPEFGGGETVSSHSFYSFSRNFPPDKKEYLAMYYDGSRPVSTSGSGPGQICLTHPGARNAVIARIKANLAKRGEGKNCRAVISLVPNDKNWCCQCPECRKVVAREKADSGALLTFVNAVAGEIRKEYPNVLIATAAYMNNVTPPASIRPADNVMIEIAQLNSEWATSAVQKKEYPDLFRPLTHPVNKEARGVFETWALRSRHLETWDYWVEWTDKFPTPYVLLNTIAEDLKFFRKNKVKRIYVEQEYFRNYPCFHALTTWIGWKLMQDPDQDLKKLVGIFMKGYYGPAAAKMSELLQFMEKSIAAVPAKSGKLSSLLPHKRPYLTLKFYRECQRLLDEAEKLCPAKSKYLLNVRKERIPFDAGLYCMWEQLKKQLPAGKKMPWKHAGLLKRYEKNRLQQAKIRWPSSYKQTLKKVEKEITLFKGLAARRSGQRPVIIQVPLQKNVSAGKLAGADWKKAFVTPVWRTVVGGKHTKSSVKARFVRDQKNLYIMLEEKNPGTLKKIWWSGDIWELFFSNRRSGKPYRQLAFNCTNEYHAYDYSGKSKGWKIPGFEYKSEIRNGLWQIRCLIPLKALMSQKELDSNSPLFLNIFRRVTAHSVTVCLNPVYEAGMHDMTRLAELRFDPPWPADHANLFRGKKYTLSRKPNYAHCLDPATEMRKLTDGAFAPPARPVWLEKKHTVGFSGAKPEITVDMEKERTVDAVYYHTGAGTAGVEPPPHIKVYAKNAGGKFELIGERRTPSTLSGGYRPVTIRIPVRKIRTRYIRIAVSGAYFLFCDEIGATGK